MLLYTIVMYVCIIECKTQACKKAVYIPLILLKLYTYNYAYITQCVALQDHCMVYTCTTQGLNRANCTSAYGILCMHIHRAVAIVSTWLCVFLRDGILTFVACQNRHDSYR